MLAFWIWHYVLLILIQFGLYFLESGPTLINAVVRAAAFIQIQICAASRAEPSAGFRAHTSHRQRQLYLFSHQIVDIDNSVLIKAKGQIIFPEFVLIARPKWRQIDEVK
jgi:hypothetical protein